MGIIKTIGIIALTILAAIGGYKTGAPKKNPRALIGGPITCPANQGWEKVYWPITPDSIDSITYKSETQSHYIEQKYQLRHAWLNCGGKVISHNNIAIEFHIDTNRPDSHQIDIQTLNPGPLYDLPYEGESTKFSTENGITTLTITGGKEISFPASGCRLHNKYDPDEGYQYMGLIGKQKIEKWKLQRSKPKNKPDAEWSQWQDIELSDYVYNRKRVFVCKRAIPLGNQDDINLIHSN